MTSFRFELDSAGVRALEQSPEIRSAVGAAANQIAGRARALEQGVGVHSRPSEIDVINAGQSRARSYVRAIGPDAEPREAKYRILGRALGGG